jgi:predicted porin
MKRILALTTLAAACSSCLAQSDTVTLYGLVDAGVNRVTGLRGGTNNQVVSGIMEGSRLGVRGNENIGGGWRALFTAESRVEANNGSVSNRPASGSQVPDRLNTATLMGLPSNLQPFVAGVAANLGGTVGVNLAGNFWDRQIYVGLVTPVGAVLVGRQYTPAYEVAGTFETMQTQSSLAAGQITSLPTGIEIRSSNAVQYRIVQGPITAAAMYVFGGVPGNRKANQLIGLQAVYRGEMFEAGFAHNTRNNENAAKALTSTVLGAAAKLGSGRANVMVAKITEDNPSGLSTIAAGLQAQGLGATPAGLIQSAFITKLKQDGILFNVGYKFETGPNTIYVTYSAFNDKTTDNADVASYGLAYTYALSKRTDLNLVLSHFNNKGLAQAAPGGAGFLGGVTEKAGTDSNNFAFGIRHRF